MCEGRGLCVGVVKGLIFNGVFQYHLIEDIKQRLQSKGLAFSKDVWVEMAAPAAAFILVRPRPR